MGYITIDEKVFRKLTTEELAQYIVDAGVNK
jgi:hypothetical protein